MDRVARIAAICLAAALVGAPFYWLTISALKTPQDVLAFPPTWFPMPARPANLPDALDLLSPRAFVNSLIFTVSVTVLQLILVISTGFALAKLPFPGRRALFRLYVATMMVPFHVMLIPTFLVVRELNLIDTYVGLIVPIVAQTAFGVFLYRQFFHTLPDELFEAARIDGATWGQIFARIAVPLAGPPTAAYVALTALTAWNMYVWPLVATTSGTMKVLPLVLAGLGGDYSQVPANIQMMAVLISILPVVLVFLFAQRWFVAGLGGALKE
jgi:ABC-type glycerol-3-phosphate transport system permease component